MPEDARSGEDRIPEEDSGSGPEDNEKVGTENTEAVDKQAASETAAAAAEDGEVPVADDVEETYIQAAEPVPPPQPFSRKMLAPVVCVLVIIMLILAAGSDSLTDMLGFGDDDDDDDDDEVPPRLLEVNYTQPVMLERSLSWIGAGTQDFPDGVIGYEPSLAVDSTGAMFYTAHKDLQWQQSWDYTASWWFISTDGGETWRDPDDLLWNTQGKNLWAGDEGDIAIDAEDNIYYIDTWLGDNHYHVFRDGGDTYVGSKEHQSTLLDDRPWIAAQGDGIIHYLGNNGVSINGARWWYYRSTNGGLTFSAGRPMPAGWASIDAVRFGDHVYMAHEGSDAANNPDVFMYTSDDQGVTWGDRVYVGPMVRNGVGEGWPTVFHGAEGTSFVIWQDSPEGGNAPGTVYLSRSDDYGRTYEYWNISMPEGAVYLYPTVNVCQYGEFHERNRLGISFYATTDVPVGPDSEWYLYAAVAENPMNGTEINYTKADPNVLYTGNDLHALHDFYEIVIAPDGSINIAYQMNIGSHPYEAGEEQRYLMFVRGGVED